MSELDKIKEGDILKVEGGSMTYSTDLFDGFKLWEAETGIPAIKDGTIGFNILHTILLGTLIELDELKEKIAQIRSATVME